MQCTARLPSGMAESACLETLASLWWVLREIYGVRHHFFRNIFSLSLNLGRNKELRISGLGVARRFWGTRNSSLEADVNRASNLLTASMLAWNVGRTSAAREFAEWPTATPRVACNAPTATPCFACNGHQVLTHAIASSSSPASPSSPSRI